MRQYSAREKLFFELADICRELSETVVNSSPKCVDGKNEFTSYQSVVDGN